MIDPQTGHHTAMDLVHSAAYATPWAKDRGLSRYGPTPTYDAVLAEQQEARSLLTRLATDISMVGGARRG